MLLLVIHLAVKNIRKKLYFGIINLISKNIDELLIDFILTLKKITKF